MALTLRWIPIPTIWLLHLYIYIHISFLLDSCKKYLAFQISYKKLFLTDTVDWRTTSTLSRRRISELQKNCRNIGRKFLINIKHSLLTTVAQWGETKLNIQLERVAIWHCDFCEIDQYAMLVKRRWLWLKTMSIGIFLWRRFSVL